MCKLKNIDAAAKTTAVGSNLQQNSYCEAKVKPSSMPCILNVCCIATLVSQGQSARCVPTYEHPTSYYCLTGETAPPNSNASFSPDGLIVSIDRICYRDQSSSMYARATHEMYVRV